MAHTIPQGLEPSMQFSFPSGHSATAACIFLTLAMISKSRMIHTICVFLIFLIGYSRIYLYMHFPVDVFAGIVIGLSVSLIIFKYVDSWLASARYAKLDGVLWKRIF
jgi:undecaprenyl-diphosphatase